MLGMRYSHVGDHPVVPVHLTGQIGTIWDRLGCLSGAFCSFNGLVQLLITFKHWLGMLTKSLPIRSPSFPPLPSPPVAGCAIQP